MRKKLFYAILIAIASLTSCENVDNDQHQVSLQEQNYAKRLPSALVSIDEAKSIASRLNPGMGIDFDCADRIRFPVFSSQQLNEVITIYDKDNIPVMYLFNADKEGFLLLSASKLEEPILAYSTESSLDLADMPRDLAIWIDLGVTKISQLNRKEFYYDISVYDAWKSLGFAQPVRDWVFEGIGGELISLPTFTRENVGCPYIDPTTKTGPLLQNIMWGQGKGYNQFQDEAVGCTNENNENNDGKYWAGCVMVAFGQIMKYYNDFGDFSSSMLNNGIVVDKVTNLNEGVNVSKVLRGIFDVTPGNQESNTKTRNCDGTGAFIYNTANGIKSLTDNNNQSFKYSSANYYSNYNSAVVLQNIIQNQRPIVLAGYKVDEEKYQSKTINIKYKQNNKVYSNAIKLGVGHAWVCDGYKNEKQKVKITNNSTGEVSYEIEDKREFWHMNWGWHIMEQNTAYGNGWYRDGLFNPVSSTSGGLIDYDDTVGYDLDGNGFNEGAYHLGYYYNRSMVADIIP